jgi:ABC-2 type transport system ATP-binding protein
MTPSGAAIVVDNVGKVFNAAPSVAQMLRGRFVGQPLRALDAVSFSAAPGEVIGVMGPNGAGKSTLLRIVGGLLIPTTGRAEIAGFDVARNPQAIRSRVSFVVGDERSFHFRVTGRGNLMFFAALHGLSGRAASTRVAELLERVGLGDAADRRYREYSRGMRQRLAIARGLLGEPAVVLLDEPTLGLDPKGARDLRVFLRDDVIRKFGRTAVVCSNDPAEVRALTDRVVFLERGRLRSEAPPARIEAELGL